jgi:hypothetical protein
MGFVERGSGKSGGGLPMLPAETLAANNVDWHLAMRGEESGRGASLRGREVENCSILSFETLCTTQGTS